MEDTLKEILIEMRYQNKLLETLLTEKPEQNMQKNMEKAMEMVLNMSVFQKAGLTKDTLNAMMKGETQ